MALGKGHSWEKQLNPRLCRGGTMQNGIGMGHYRRGHQGCVCGDGDPELWLFTAPERPWVLAGGFGWRIYAG